MASTGPKISSRAIVMSGVTSPNTVGLDVIAAVEARRPAEAARDQLRALLDADADQALDLVELRLADDRPEIDALRARIADLERPGRPRRRSPALRRWRGGHQHARRRVAGLAAVAEAGEDACPHRSLEIRVGQDDVGRFAAEFLGDALDRVGRGLGDDDPGAGRAGERHHVDVRVARHHLPDARPVAVDEIEDAGAARRPPRRSRRRGCR